MRKLWKRFWKWFLQVYVFKYECGCQKTGLTNWCGALLILNHKAQGVACTLPKGHRGKHVACGTSEHRLRVWKK